MIPNRFMVVDSLPLAPNGKIDRNNLPKPTYQRDDSTASSIRFYTNTEKIIADVWKELLDIDEITANDNFFDLGGHSLLSMQVIAKMDEQFGVKLNPREFIFQTLGQMAACIDNGLYQ